MSEKQERSVPFFNYQEVFGRYRDQIMDATSSVLRRGAFIQQSDLLEFERALAEYLGVKHAFGVANATDGLIISLRAIGLSPGDEVIVPSHTMVATAASVFFAGGVPVPVDCDSDHLMDPAVVEPAITGRTKGIIPVQLNGRTCAMDKIEAVANRYGLFIVEDSAQALGSRYQGKYAGTFGRAGVFSFYPAKILGGMGDGGAVVTDDDEMAEQIALLRDHGRGADGEVKRWGLNSRLDNLQAAVLHLQFKDYQEIIQKRRGLASRYDERLRELKQLVLPPPPSDGPHFDVFQNYEIEADCRDELRAHLTARGIGTIIQWGGKAVHQFTDLGFKVSLPMTERLFSRCMMLPMNMALSMRDVDHVCDTIIEFYHS